jgi:hypothetical protein
MDTKKPTDSAATVIIGQRIRAGSEALLTFLWVPFMIVRVVVGRGHRG